MSKKTPYNHELRPMVDRLMEKVITYQQMCAKDANKHH